MSQYISSFLIEPVVRQARRFSRSNTEDTTSWNSDQHPLPLHNHHGLPTEGSQRFAPEESIDNVWTSRLDTRIPRPDETFPRESVGPSLDSEGDEDGEELGAMEDRQRHAQSPTPSAVVLALDETPASVARRNISQTEDDTSNNPLYGVAGSFVSTNSSFSTSAQSMSDAASMTMLGDESTRTTRQNSGGGAEDFNFRVGDRALPADDGMSQMRRRILAIQRTESSSDEKARLIHQLMTEQYSSSQSSLQAPQPSRARSPASLASHERPFTPNSLQSVETSAHCTSPRTSLCSLQCGSKVFNLSPEDIKPTYYKRPVVTATETESESPSSDRLSDQEDEEERPLGCVHYKRNIKLQCSACDRWYTCRFCHDEVEDHSLNRRETRNMLCMLCGCAQVASETCTQCGERSAKYYCGICKLWDDARKHIYHCNDCGICRIGRGIGKDFYHCKVSCHVSAKPYLGSLFVDLLRLSINFD